MLRLTEKLPYYVGKGRSVPTSSGTRMITAWQIEHNGQLVDRSSLGPV